MRPEQRKIWYQVDWINHYSHDWIKKTKKKIHPGRMREMLQAIVHETEYAAAVLLE